MTVQLQSLLLHQRTNSQTANLQLKGAGQSVAVALAGRGGCGPGRAGRGGGRQPGRRDEDARQPPDDEAHAQRGLAAAGGEGMAAR
jgi:hypothetical protein